ncbi:uncharacterized protein LOC135349217 [Halichondria panicea]|uniref:uncharacterized protein LOC135349217 n=1 Tax=Halichondria panicea TaxID=6063 RepID=UPI00312BBD17
MEKLSVTDVGRLLRENCFPETVVSAFKENLINGIAVLQLPNDFEEFKHMLPQSGLRMALKSLLEKENCSMSGTIRQMSASYNLIEDYNMGDFEDEAVANHPLAMLPARSDEAAEPPAKKPRTEEYEVLAAPTKTLPTPCPLVLAAPTKTLPTPCPLPPVFSERVNRAIIAKQIYGKDKLALIREASLFYYGLCPNPKGNQYDEMAKVLCNSFEQLRNKIVIDGCYWHTVKQQVTMFFRNRRRRSVPSAIKPLKTEKAHLVQIIAAKPAEAAPGQDSVISVDECAYDRNHGRLCDQFTKKAPNNAAITQLIRETHQQRRKRIGDSGDKMSILLLT